MDAIAAWTIAYRYSHVSGRPSLIVIHSNSAWPCYSVAHGGRLAHTSSDRVQRHDAVSTHSHIFLRASTCCHQWMYVLGAGQQSPLDVTWDTSCVGQQRSLIDIHSNSAWPCYCITATSLVTHTSGCGLHGCGDTFPPSRHLLHTRTGCQQCSVYMQITLCQEPQWPGKKFTQGRTRKISFPWSCLRHGLGKELGRRRMDRDSVSLVHLQVWSASCVCFGAGVF